MTYTEEAKAIITGSYILYLIDSLLDKSEHSNGTTIQLKQKLLAKTKKANVKKLIDMSNVAWFDTIEEFKDRKMHLVIFDAVESLAFSESKVMEMMFGKDILDVVSRFAMKQSRDGVDNDILLESREITQALKKYMSKVIFNNKDKK